MFLKGVFKSQWTSLWGQQPSVEQQSEEDDGADAGDDDAVMQLTQASPNVLTRDSPLRKRPRSATSDEEATCNPLPSQQHNNSEDQHHHHIAIIADGSSHGHPSHRAPSAHATESPCTPNTVRSSLSKYVQHSSLPQDCAAASSLDDVLRHPSLLVGAEVQLWHAPHHHNAAKVAVDARHIVAPISRPFPSVAGVSSASLPPPQAAEVCHVLSHIWFRMVRDHQRASPGYVITDEDCWRSTVQAAARRYPVKEDDAIGAVAATLVLGVDFHTRGAGPRGSTAHNAAGVATADDDDRWIPALRQLSQRMLSHHAQRSSSNSSADYHHHHHHHLCAAPPPPFANSTTVCSDTFDSSIDAVRSLMLHMIEAETYIDPSTWLVAFIYAERMHQQYVASHGHQHSGRTCRHTDPSAPLWRQTERGGETTTPTEFVFYRRHELRILFALFTLAVKQLSDLYVTVRNLHRCLPSFITSYQHHASSAQRSDPPAAVLPLSLRQKFPHIAQRLEASMVAESTMMSRQYAEHDGPLTPPYSLGCAGRMEVAILRGGLGYRTLVREHDMNELLSQYASPSEAALLMRYMQHRIQAKR